MMRIFKPLEEIKDFKNLVFLAGPCPRKGQDWEDWRNNLIAQLDSAGFEGDVANPTNENYDEDDPDYYNKQCTWETQAFHYASVIVFWVDRNDEHPALTTNIEFGIWSAKAPKSLIVGIPEGSKHCGYIKWVCKQKGIECHETMEEMTQAIMARFNHAKNVYFTSDTHFGANRTLDFSARPFMDTNEMDLEIISKWNKKVHANDIIFHLGDFGEIYNLSKLNFGKMYFLKGNYERGLEEFDIEDPRVVIENDLSIGLDGKHIECVHEPLCNMDYEFFLFGHIHEKSKVKRNGFNVGTDANNFEPVSIDTIRFYMNAILNHYDENVFCDKCE